MRLIHWASCMVVAMFGALIGAALGSYYMVYIQLAQCP